jgi:hypothetical protein
MVMNDIGNSEGTFFYDDTNILKIGKKFGGSDHPLQRTVRTQGINRKAAQLPQYCGGDVFGWGLLDTRLYMSDKWFNENYEDLRKNRPGSGESHV